MFCPVVQVGRVSEVEVCPKVIVSADCVMPICVNVLSAIVYGKNEGCKHLLCKDIPF